MKPWAVFVRISTLFFMIGNDHGVSSLKYELTPGKHTLPEAMNECRNMNGQLASLEDDFNAELNEIAETVKHHTEPVWIGGFCRKVHWVWTREHKTFHTQNAKCSSRKLTILLYESSPGDFEECKNKCREREHDTFMVHEKSTCWCGQPMYSSNWENYPCLGIETCKIRWPDNSEENCSHSSVFMVGVPENRWEPMKVGSAQSKGDCAVLIKDTKHSDEGNVIIQQTDCQKKYPFLCASGDGVVAGKWSCCKHDCQE